MIDGAVLAGYLAVAATRASGRAFDAGVDALFDRLAQRVEQRLGGRAVAEVETNPGDTERQERLGRGIDAVARTDPQLARDLATLQGQLDQKVGRQFIEAVRAHPIVQAATGAAAPGVAPFTPFAVPDMADYWAAPRLVRILVVTGLLVCMVGFGMAFFGILGLIGSVSDAVGGDSSGDGPTLTSALPGFGVFFCGIAIVVAGNIGKALSRRR